MLRKCHFKSTMASLMAIAMLFTGNISAVCAAESIEEQVASEKEVLAEEVSKPAESQVEGEDKYNIEINQGFSLHVDKDMLNGGDVNYMSNFVASKKTVIMISIDAKNDDEAKKVTENWELYYKKVTDGNEADAKELSWKGSEFGYMDYYDKDSVVVAGKKMAYVTLKTGPSKGKYNFYLEEGGNVVASSKNIDFYETKHLNILAVPVNAYYSKSANVKPEGGGGCPENLVGQSVGCENNWNGVIDQVKKYLVDVYPIADITVEEGQTLNCGEAKYDMCTDDGQKALWEEACKLQSKDKNTGKDKYDLILAFVMYRQDATGTGQGYTYGKPTNIITLTDPDMLPTVAHEIAHCYEVGDEYDGGSYNYRVNNLPLEFKSKGRDKITSEEVTDTTDYTIKNVEKYTEENKSNYYWLSSGQYKNSLADGTKVYDGDKNAIEENGNGSVVYPSLHPFILSDMEFVHFAKNGDTIYPTISYMGSGYSGEKFYYFTTSVIWDHLFNQFLVKEKKPENNENNNNENNNNENNNNESGEQSSDGEGEEPEAEDDDLDLYFDEDYREGESRMIEVSGSVEYTSKDPEATVSGCEVEPMFSYDGDLSYIEYFDETDKDVRPEDRFVFAAIDKSGKVVMSPVDGEESTVEFYGGNFNSGMPAPTPDEIKYAKENDIDVELLDKRFQDFCEFSFDAEYPEGTDAFIIVQKNDYDAAKTYNKDNVLWFKNAPDKIIDGELLGVKAGKTEFTLSWNAAAYDEDDKATTKGLYTMLYYAPQGDDGDVYFVEDGDYENDFGAKEDGYASYTFNPSEYTSNITDKAYVWVKVSDGVNGLDLYTDEFKPATDPDPNPNPDPNPVNPGEKVTPSENTVSGDKVWTQKEIEDLVAKEADSPAKTQVPGDTVPLYKDKKVYKPYQLSEATGDQVITINAGTKIMIPELALVDMDKVEMYVDGKKSDIGEARKHVKIKSTGLTTVKVDKNIAAYSLVFPTEKFKLTLNVVNVGFNKALKKQFVTAGNSVSVNLVEFVGKQPSTASSEFLSAEWFIDGKTAVAAGSTNTSKKGLQVVVSKDNRTLTVSAGQATKGSVKITAVINGKKYTTSIKVKA